jgi:hypothetical protein
MALTAENDQRLEDAGLTDFFDKNKPLFKAMATEAYRYAAGYVQAAGLPVRVDDVALPLEGALKVSEPLGTFLSEHRLNQRYWFRYFADLILDRLWKELSGDANVNA